MSPKRQPIPLYESCISYFAHTLNFLCIEHESDLNKSSIHGIVDYIQKYMPMPIQAHIGEAIIHETDHLQKLLLPSQVQLTLLLRVRCLSISGSVVQSGALDNINGSQLLTLALLYRGSQDTASRLYGFLQTAIYLTHLTCTDFCNNHMMEIIGKTCPNLLYLDLNACNDVTDEGILRLCGRSETVRECIEILKNNKLISTSKVAPTLKELRLKMTRVTEAGIAVILLLLTNICLLLVPDIPMKPVFDFLGTIENRNDFESSLQEFHCMEALNERHLQVLRSFCPNISYIQMTFTGNYQIDLVRLEKIVFLKKLTAIKFADLDVDALVVFLRIIGKQIKNLQLFVSQSRLFEDEKLKITSHHIWSIGADCPKLETFHLKGYLVDGEENTGNIRNSSLFANLRTLKIEAIKLSEEDLRTFLLNCKHIKYLDLSLKNPHVLHDRLVNSIIDKGKWRNMIKLRILNSPITSKIMTRVVLDCPNLKELGCITTWLIAKQQALDLQKRIINENLDINLFL